VIGNVVTAMRAGYILRDPANWKRKQVAVNALTLLITAALGIANYYGHNYVVPQEVLTEVVIGVWSVVSLFNGWATVATTDKIGLPARADPPKEDDLNYKLDFDDDRFTGP
jgi:hypothetical protein